MAKDDKSDPCASKKTSVPCGPTDSKDAKQGTNEGLSKCPPAEPAKSTSRFPKINLNKLSELKNMIPKNVLKHLNPKAFNDGFNSAKNWIMKNCNPSTIMADRAAAGPPRPMKYPYTYAAKFAQFPMGHYIKNQWIWKYYFISVAVCFPAFYYIHNLANSPGNVAKWAEIKRKEAAEHH